MDKVKTVIKRKIVKILFILKNGTIRLTFEWEFFVKNISFTYLYLT